MAVKGYVNTPSGMVEVDVPEGRAVRADHNRGVIEVMSNASGSGTIVAIFSIANVAGVSIVDPPGLEDSEPVNGHPVRKLAGVGRVDIEL